MTEAESIAAGEEWRRVPGFPQHEVSNLGRVRSYVRGSARLLKPKPDEQGYLRYYVKGRRRFGHSLVLAAFVGPRPDGQVTRHLDGNPANNHLTNLVYGTLVENAQDALLHGRNWQSQKTHCKHGHEFTPENIYPNARGRACIKCGRAKARVLNEARRLAKLAEAAS